MKIDLKLSPQQLDALVFSFKSIDTIPVNDREVKVARSVLDKVILKFRKKHLETKQMMTLFTKKKKLSFSLEYHEAHYLERFVTIMDSFAMSEYDRNVLRFIKSGLNQKLA
jgi:hypothetical protein